MQDQIEWFDKVKNLLLNNVSLKRKSQFIKDFKNYESQFFSTDTVKFPLIQFILETNITTQQDLLMKDIPSTLKEVLELSMLTNKKLLDKEEAKISVQFAEAIAGTSSGSNRTAALCTEAASWSTFLLSYSDIADAIIKSVESLVLTAEYSASVAEENLRVAKQAPWHAETISAWREGFAKTIDLDIVAKMQRSIARLAEAKAYDLYADKLLNILQGFYLGENHVTATAV